MMPKPLLQTLLAVSTAAAATATVAEAAPVGAAVANAADTNVAAAIPLYDADDMPEVSA